MLTKLWLVRQAESRILAQSTNTPPPLFLFVFMLILGQVKVELGLPRRGRKKGQLGPCRVRAPPQWLELEKKRKIKRVSCAPRAKQGIVPPDILISNLRILPSGQHSNTYVSSYSVQELMHCTYIHTVPKVQECRISFHFILFTDTYILYLKYRSVG